MRYRSGVTIDDVIILGVFLAQVILLAWQMNAKKQVIIDDLTQIVLDAVDDLDGRLAEALQSVAGNLGVGGDGQQMNPFQALLAQYLQLKMTENIPGAQSVVPRDENGKFTTPQLDNLDDQTT